MEKNFTDFQDTIPDNGKDMTLDAELEAYFESLDDGTVDLAEARKALAAINAAIPDKVNRRRAGRAFRFVTVAAASMFIPLLVYTCHIALKPEVLQNWTELYVPYGETGELVLSDGTKLNLNSGSRVTYPDFFTGSERKIFVDGEVVADVAKNEEMPFIIVSNDLKVKVLGTRFDFKSYALDANAELMLFEGSVDFMAESDTMVHEAIISPGEYVTYDRVAGRMDVSRLADGSYKPFTDQGAMHFFNERLSDIARELERRFGVIFVIADGNLADTHYYAYFSNGESLDEILMTLNANNSLRIKKTSDTVYLMRN